MSVFFLWRSDDLKVISYIAIISLLLCQDMFDHLLAKVVGVSFNTKITKKSFGKYGWIYPSVPCTPPHPRSPDSLELHKTHNNIKSC